MKLDRIQLSKNKSQATVPQWGDRTFTIAGSY